MTPIGTHISLSFKYPTPKKLDFDLTTHPVSVEEAQELYEKLDSRRWHIALKIKDQCEKECRKDVKPCSILLRLETMNGGIKRDPWGEDRVILKGSLDRGLRVLEDCDHRRSNAVFDVESKCEDKCRAGLKTCRLLGELEEMHEREVGARWL